MRFLSTALMILFSITIAYPQITSTGRLGGTVIGPSGLIPGAILEITDNKAGRVRTVTTSGEGTFTVPSLDVGTYTVKVTVSGFKTYISNDVKIDVGREYTMSIILELGAVSETMTVTGGGDVLNASSAALSVTVSPREVNELPLNGRNPLTLIGLQAGAAPNRGNGSEIINGGRTSTTNFTRDGIVVNDTFIRNGFVTDMPTVDNTDEFTVTTLNAGAQSGFGSSQVQLVTPRGANVFHGGIWEYNRNSKFSANQYFNNALGRYTSNDTAVIQGRAKAGDPRQALPFLNRNQFGGKIGGPIPFLKSNFRPGLLKDRAHFFFSTEKYMLRQQTTKLPTTLRSDARNGIFSYRPVAAPAAGECITFISGICTVNVLTGQGLKGAVPGVLAVDPTIQNRLISNLPVGNRADQGDGLNTIGYGFNQSDPEDRMEYTSRVDVTLTSKHAIKGSYRFNSSVDARTDIDTTFNTSARAKTSAPVHFTSLGLTSAFSRFTNEVVGGFTNPSVVFLNDVLPQETFLLSGILPNGNAGLPLISNPQLNFRDQGRETRVISFADHAYLSVGSHAIEFGGEFQTYKVRSFNQAGTGKATFNISTIDNTNTPALLATLFPGGISLNDRTAANNLRYMIGGVIGSGSATANVTSKDATAYTPGASLDRNLKYNTIAWYVQDKWNIMPGLTLNGGLRYEYYTSLKTTDGLYLEPILGADPVASVLDPNGTYNFAGTNSGNPGEFVKPDRNNFGPVVSFAYSPTSQFKFLSKALGERKTIFRGGFRVTFINDEYTRSIDNAVGGNSGLSATASALQIVNGAVTPQLNARLNNLPGITPPTYIVPPRTFAQNNTPAFSNFGTVFAVNPELQVPRQFEYNLGIQREFGRNAAFEVRYVGAYSNQLVRTIDYNQVDIRNNGFLADYQRAFVNNTLSGSIFGNATCMAGGGCQPLTVIPNLTLNGRNAVQTQITQGTPGQTAFTLIQGGNTGTVKFLQNPNTGVANVLQNAGKLRYNSLQVEFRRRLSKGLSLNTNYTFQKILTDITDDGINQARVNPYLDNQNPGLDYSRAPYDTTHLFNITNIYELPFGKGKFFLNKGGFINHIIGGWQLNNLIQIASGVPISITDANGTLNRTARSNNQTANSSLTKDEIKDLIGIYKLSADNQYGLQAGVYFINPKVLLPSGRAAGGFGSAVASNQVFFNVNPGETGRVERYFINGPIFWNWDASIIKNFQITENMRFQFRAEAFNLTNSTRFSLLPQSGIFNINSAQFGRLTTTSSPRIMQFAGRFEF